MTTERTPWSWHEKSLAACLITTVVTYAGYFALVAMSEPDPSRDMLRLVVAVIVQVVALIVVHSLFAMRDEPAPTDERDAAIAVRSDRVGYRVLAVCVFAIVSLSLSGSDLLPATWTVGQLLLLGFVVAECARFASQLVFSRRGL